MKLFKTLFGIIIESEHSFHRPRDEDWDEFVDDDSLFEKLNTIVADGKYAIADGPDRIASGLLPPIGTQELWASGVTYFRSKQGRQEESRDSGGASFYAHVYEAERPELFFKATAGRVVGSGAEVRIRRDSSWDVPEPELTLMISSSGKIIGYTIGNDMSSRSIEGENPLYLPQAKTYDGCAALGPCLYVSPEPLVPESLIELSVMRGDAVAFSGSITIDQMKRTPEELVGFLYRECSFPTGAMLMTGTGIVPGNDFTLQLGDVIEITLEPIGTLVNTVG